MPQKKKPSKLNILKKPQVLVLLVFVLGFASFGAYTIVKSQAAGLVRIYSKNNYNIYACKTKVNAFGGVFQVKVRFQKPKGSTVGPMYDVFVHRGSAIKQSIRNNTYWGGTTADVTVNASDYYNDTVQISLESPYWTTGKVNAANYANC
jgi:hypothetical protein